VMSAALIVKKSLSVSSMLVPIAIFSGSLQLASAVRTRIPALLQSTAKRPPSHLCHQRKCQMLEASSSHLTNNMRVTSEENSHNTYKRLLRKCLAELSTESTWHCHREGAQPQAYAEERWLTTAASMSAAWSLLSRHHPCWPSVRTRGQTLKGRPSNFGGSPQTGPQHYLASRPMTISLRSPC
jgi:hypothetical protein